ncbi:uroporphyrinogen-III C-methyltransferase [Crenothrix polyspora]|uniref:HemX domain protein (Modular protein) n=1 Tax=Crenothrix polyspora TaxID=360316 RepID=A0A1R4HAN0_9GAMM|nr:uroporphyrinogen-III C-methyltransferase [Crenothrix polyspora]SJM93318.1 HemX domain protein (modular protein) [Crenothrix polyspora]
MAELTEQQESPVGDTKHPPKSRGGFWFGATVLLLVTGLAGAGFFLFSQLRAKQEGLNGEVKSEMSKQLGGYQGQLTEIEKQIAALQTDISGKDAHFTKTLDDFSRLHGDKLDSTRKQLNESIVRLQRQLGKTRGDWLIADAEYLLSVANERLYLIGDVNTTRQALEAADQRLRESGDASAFKVRDQVIKDIAALANIQPVDVVGLYAAIQSLEDRVNNLVLLLPYSGKTLEKTHTQAPATESSGAGGLLEDAKHKLSEIVTIKHTDQSVKEILTPEQAQFIRDQLRVKLEVVKVALVQQNEALYQAGLADARKWLEQQFAQNSDTKAFVSELNRFDAIKLRSHFPDISLSLKMLKDITKLRIETDKSLDSSEPVSSTDTDTDVAPVTGSTQAMPSEADLAKSSTSLDSTGSVASKPDAAIMSPSEPITPESALPAKADTATMPSSQPITTDMQAPKPLAAPPQPSSAPVADHIEPSIPEYSDVIPPDDNQRAMDNGGIEQEASKADPSPVAKLLEKVKQYLPGKH